MNSFIENVNYLAELDNNYGDGVVLSKSNLSLRNVANNITLRFSYFNYNTREIETVNKTISGMLYTGLETALQEFCSQIESTLGGNKFDASYTISSANTGFLIHNFSITINSLNEKLKCTEINFNAKITSTQVEIYNLYGNVINPLKLLPTLALLDRTFVDSIITVGESIEDITIVADNIIDVNTVSDNITNVNIVGTDILDVNIVSSNISSVNTVSSNIESVNTVSNYTNEIVSVNNDLTNIDSVASNINNVNNVGLNISAVNSVNENIDKIITDANNIGSIVIVGNDLSNAGYSNLLDAGSITDVVTSEPIGTSLIETVAENITNVNVIGSNITSVNTVGNNIADVASVAQQVVPNLAEILLADENATIAITKASEASTSKELAHKWADNPEDVPVVGTVGINDEYSAYHWAKKAEAVVGGNITLDSLYDVDTTGILDGGTIVWSQSLGQWVDYDFAHNDKLALDLTAGVTVATGEIAWNADEGTADLGLPGGSTLQIGQENVRTVRNSTASTISNGRLCMFDGTIGNSGRIKVKPFTAGFNEAMYLYGVATQNIISGSDGIITIDGKVRGIDTTGASVGEVWHDEDILYAKPNDNGMMTNVMPADNELKLVVASVIKAHTSGTLEIRFMPFNENMYYTKVQNDILLNSKVPLNGDFILDLGGL